MGVVWGRAGHAGAWLAGTEGMVGKEGPLGARILQEWTKGGDGVGRA